MRRRPGADRARPVAGLRRHAHRQRRAWRVLHARRRARLVLREPRPGPAGARLPARADRAARWSSARSRSLAERLVLKRLNYDPGSDDRRHDRPPLHHPAAGADLLRAGRAAGAGADQLPHPVPLVRLFRLQARRRRRLARAARRHLARADAHAARPRHARHAIRPRDRRRPSASRSTASMRPSSRSAPCSRRSPPC